MTMNKIRLNTGEEVNINTQLTLANLRKAQDEGLISKSFISNIIKASMGGKVGVEDIDFDDATMINLPYICYKNGNGSMDMDTFMSKMPLNLEIIGEVLCSVLASSTSKTEGNLANDFRKATPKKKNNGKKKKHQG